MRDPIKVRIIRGDKTAPGRQSSAFEIKKIEPLTVYRALVEIYENMDQTLAFRTHRCYRGTCGSCSVTVNGQKARGCKKLIFPGESVELGPDPNFEIVRDLVVDFSKKKDKRGDRE